MPRELNAKRTHSECREKARKDADEDEVGAERDDQVDEVQHDKAALPECKTVRGKQHNQARSAVTILRAVNRRRAKLTRRLEYGLPRHQGR